MVGKKLWWVEVIDADLKIDMTKKPFLGNFFKKAYLKSIHLLKIKQLARKYDRFHSLQE